MVDVKKVYMVGDQSFDTEYAAIAYEKSIAVSVFDVEKAVGYYNSVSRYPKFGVDPMYVRLQDHYDEVGEIFLVRNLEEASNLAYSILVSFTDYFCDEELLVAQNIIETGSKLAALKFLLENQQDIGGLRFGLSCFCRHT